MSPFDVGAFQKAIGAFEEAKRENSKHWPAIFEQFKAAFASARKDRATSTPRLNILSVFGLKTRELRHSQALAWFLDENETHEQGGLFMNCLLKRCGVNLPTCAKYTVQREKPDNVDVVAYKPGVFSLFIENKVNHHERPSQLADLQDSLVNFSTKHGIPEEHRIAVFLTDDGRAPTTAHTEPLAGLLTGNLYPIRRMDLFTAFREALDFSPASSTLLRAFMDGYVAMISTHHGSNQ